MVFFRVKVSGDTTQTSPWSTGEMKRVTKIRPSLATDTPAGVGPSISSRLTWREAGSISTTLPVAYNDT